MELASTDDLAALGAADLVRVSASIPRAAPRTSALLAAFLVVPLSCAVLAQFLLPNPVLLRLGIQHVSVTFSNLPLWLLSLVAYQALHFIVLYTFHILSTAGAVATVASLYANKQQPEPASKSSSSLTVLLLVLANLLDTFALRSLLTGTYYLVFGVTILPPMIVFVPDAFESDSAKPLPLPILLFVIVVAVVYLGIIVYILAVWHLASVITVVEPLSGLAAMARSRQLLQGRTSTAATLVVCYLAVSNAASVLFRAAVVEGSFGLAWPGRLLVGAVLACLVVCVNLLGLLVQTVLYYGCKAYHKL